MEPETIFFSDPQQLVARTEELDRERLDAITLRADRQFAVLAVIEWACAICAAWWIAPLAWNGQTSTIHPHVWIAIGLGGLIISLPVGLALTRPGTSLTRHVTAASQMLMAGLLVHMTGGRIETHFAYFGLLAFLSFYYDWWILVTATVVAGSDHLLRAIMWPESMYGVPAVTLWRPLEHAGWVVFEIVVLVLSIQENRRGMRAVARRQSRLEAVSAQVTSEVEARTAQLAESEERYRTIFEDSPLPMWVCDTETLTFLAVNQQAVRKYGYSEAEFLRMHTHAIRPREETVAVKAFLGNRALHKSPMQQWRHRKKDGTIIDVELTSRPIKWAGRKAVMVLSIDVSERKRAEREKEAMEIQLRHAQKLESIGQLAAGIAHEINTPTQYIGDNLHFLRDAFKEVQAVLETQNRVLLRDDHEPLHVVAAEIKEVMESADTLYLMEEIPKALDQAIDGVDRVSTLVKAMKAFSHPGQKEKTPANINEAIQNTITVARNEWKYVAQMEMDLAADLPLVPCLINDFNQVVLNLVVNAAHAIGSVVQGGAQGKITIATRACSGYVEVRVQDTGSGIPVEVRDRIFDPFFTTKEVGKGTGQGLAIARSVVVDKHGGTIHFETEIGKGTAFVVRLPIDDGALTPAHRTEPSLSVLARSSRGDPRGLSGVIPSNTKELDEAHSFC